MKLKYFACGIIASLLLCGCSIDSSGNSGSSSSTSPSSPSDSGSSSTHTHTFDVTTWEHDGTYHWHKSTCGHDVVDAKAEHSYKDVVIPATEEEGGYTSHKCIVCDYSYNSDQTPNLTRQRALGMIPVFDDTQKYLTYGLYPQTHVNDPATITALNALTTAESNGWYLYNDEYYAKKTAKPYDSNGYTPPSYAFDDGTAIKSGVSYWFKCEPIEWKILTSGDDTYSLVSTVLLDAHRYNELYSGTKDGYYANNYANSEIRSWLNDDFLNIAFNLDSSLIQTTTVDNSASTTDSSSNIYACENTEDMIYLLSYQDYLNAGYEELSTSAGLTMTREYKTTDYARANGIFYSAGLSSTASAWCWTRSPSSYRSSSAWFGINDCYLIGGNPDIYESCGGVRPALTIKYPL